MHSFDWPARNCGIRTLGVYATFAKQSYNELWTNTAETAIISDRFIERMDSH